MFEYSSASILPIVASGKDLYFFLGREEGTRARITKRWCAFGGRKKQTDNNDPCVTAAREFVEESANCVKLFKNDLSILDYQQHIDLISKRLANEEYLLRLKLHRRSSKRHAHILYMVLIDFEASIVHNFNLLRAAQDACSYILLDKAKRAYLRGEIQSGVAKDCLLPGFVQLSNGCIATRPDWAEKRELRLWTTDELKEVIQTYAQTGEGKCMRASSYFFRHDMISVLILFHGLLCHGISSLCEGSGQMSPEKEILKL